MKLPKNILRLFSSSTGALDINHKSIKEGDEVYLYAKEYQKTELSPSWEIESQKIYELDIKSPKPIKDIILARGQVIWDTFTLSYMIKYLWTCPQWNSGISSCQMGGDNYVYEIVG